MEIYVVSDARMNAKDLDTYTVQGLGVGSGVEDYGYVIFCKKRTGNTALYSFINEHVLVPLINNIRDNFSLSVENHPASVQMDGEKIQIDIYKHSSVLNLLKNNNINVYKSPASCTEIFQPCDVGSCFKSAKAVNKTVRDEDVDTNNPTFSLLKKMYEDHDNYVNVSKKFPAAHRRMGMYGLMRVQKALNMSLNATAARESFGQAGIFPFSTKQICLQCKSPFSDVEIKSVEDNLLQLEQILKDFGEIADSTLSRLGFEYH